MSLKPEQIKIDANDKLIISGAKNGATGIAQGMGAHADSQLTFALETTGTAGIKLFLRDSAIHGSASAVSGQSSQIEAASIGADDLAPNAVNSAKILADAVDETKIEGADGASTSNDYDFSGVNSFLVPTPTADGHAATKKYVDDKAQGLDFKDSVVVATTAALTATYSSSELTLTNADTQAAFALDGVTVTAGERILIKDQADASQNGIYVLSTAGDASSNWVLTRASDFNSDAEITSGAYVLTTEGTSNKLNAYVLESPSGGGDPTLDTDDLSWLLFSGSATSVSGGNGISVSGVTVAVDRATASGLTFISNKLAVNVANGLEISSDEVGVQLGGQSASNQNESLIVASSTGNDGLAVKVDADTISVGTNGLQAAVLAKGIEGGVAADVTGSSPGTTGITLSKIPAQDCDVFVFINGVLMLVGDATTTGAEVFFMPASDTNVSNVRGFNSLQSGDELWFAPNVAGFDYDASEDEVKISFMAL